MTWLLFRYLHFSTVLSCLYWDSVLLYLHVDSFSWSYFRGQLDVIFETSQNNGPPLFNNWNGCHGAASVAVCYSSSPASKRINKKIFLLPCYYYTLNFPNGINT